MSQSQQDAALTRVLLAEALELAKFGDAHKANLHLRTAQTTMFRVTQNSPEKVGLYDLYVQTRDDVKAQNAATGAAQAAQRLADTQALNARRKAARVQAEEKAKAGQDEKLKRNTMPARGTVPDVPPPTEPFYQEQTVTPDPVRSAKAKWVIGSLALLALAAAAAS